MKKFVFGAAAIGLLATAGAYAQSDSPMGGMAKDVTRAESMAKAGQMWAKLDANSDGKLDQTDRAAMQGRMFDRIDTDHNGSISREEFAAHHAGRGPEGAGSPGQPPMAGMGDHKMGGRGMRGGHRMGGMGGHGMARMADANKDGVVTKAEYDAAVVKHFDTVDADHNGTITKAERQAAHEKMRAAWKAKAAG